MDRPIRVEDLQGQPRLSRRVIEALVQVQPATVREALKIHGVGRKTTRRLLKLGILADSDASQVGSTFPVSPSEHPESTGVDERVEVQRLFSNLKSAVPRLRRLLEDCTGHWGYEDPVYRFYHQSFKVYELQETTAKIVLALQALAPDRKLNAWFVQIVEDGTGHHFDPEHNRRWIETTRPILEAFFHARYFLDVAVRYGTILTAPPQSLPSGWAALLYLYDLR